MAFEVEPVEAGQREESCVGLAAFGTMSMSGRFASNCAARRTDAVPTRAPFGRSQGVGATKEIKTSRGSSRAGMAAVTRPACCSAGMSFMECTAKRAAPERSASSISLVKSPLPPISASEPERLRSPVET